MVNLDTHYAHNSTPGDSNHAQHFGQAISFSDYVRYLPRLHAGELSCAPIFFNFVHVKDTKMPSPLPSFSPHESLFFVCFYFVVVFCTENFAPHILVTAPSNVAVDNIVSRILEEGFLDGKYEAAFLEKTICLSLNMCRPPGLAQVLRVGVVRPLNPRWCSCPTVEELRRCCYVVVAAIP